MLVSERHMAGWAKGFCPEPEGRDPIGLGGPLFLPVLTAAAEKTEPDTHVVFAAANFLGRGFDSRRLHHSVFSRLLARHSFWA